MLRNPKKGLGEIEAHSVIVRKADAKLLVERL
jgi:hypothetical protein